MKKLLYPIFLLLSACNLTAQYLHESSQFHEIYRLNDRDAYAALVEGAAFDTAWLHTPLGITDTLREATLPPSYYLSLQAVQEHIQVAIFLRHAFEVTLLPTRRDLALIVTSPSGARLPDARVTIDGRKVRFDEKMQCYRRSGRKKGGMLEVKALGRRCFYEVKVNGRYSIREMRWQRLSAHPIGRILAVPRQKFKRTWYLIQHPSVFPDYWNQWLYRHEEKYESKERWNGYVAFSQPKYRPGDTLEVKAWITDRKNKPWNKPVELEIRQGYGGRRVDKRTLSPLSPGAFTWQMILSDSLQIDRSYQVSFNNPKPKKRGLFNWYEPEPGSVEGSFFYEDYTLDEIKYSFSQDKDSYSGEDSIVFHLEARDATGQPVADGYYKLVVVTSTLHSFYAPEMAVPDTIWTTENSLAATGEMDIRVPDRFLPNGNYSLSAKVYLTGSSGELQTKQLNLQVERRIPVLSARVEKGWLLLSRKDGQPSTGTVLLKAEYQHLESAPDTISLPYRARIKPEAMGYRLTSGAEMLYIRPNDAQFGKHGISAIAFQTGDTATCILQNPHGIPVQYRVWGNKKEWEKGLVADSVWVGQFANPEKRNVHARFVFVWGGEEQEISASVVTYKNQLDVRIEQPENVLPGEQVQVKIKVTDQSEKPAVGVDLTAGAYNALFQNRKPYETPNIRHRQQPYPLLFNPFNLEELSIQGYVLPLSEKWYRRWHLDALPYYQLRQIQDPSEGPAAFVLTRDIRSSLPHPETEYSSPGVLPDLPQNADSFYINRPQFAPFVIKNRHAQPVYMVWVNKNLVYYHGSTDEQPYSFYGEYGYNSIRIRTRDSEYTVDSVFLDRGKKVIFSIYAADWSNKPVSLQLRDPVLSHARISRQPRPDTLTTFERLYLQKTMLLLRGAPYSGARYLWEDASNIHIAGKKKEVQLLGPFSPGREINVLVPGHFLSRVRFDPGFEYEILPQRERLYAADLLKGKTFLPMKLPLLSPNQWAVAPFQIQRGVPKYPFQNPQADKPGMGSLRIQFYQPSALLKGIVLRRDTFTGLYTPGTFSWGGLVPGKYRIALYTTENTVSEDTFFIRRDTILCLDLSRRAFRPLGPAETFDKLFGTGLMSAAPAIPTYFQQQNGFGSVIQGRITDETGEPLIGATVILRQGSELVRGVVTDIDGYYRIQVLPGLYELEVSYTGFTSQQGNVSIRAGETGFADYALQDNGDMLSEVVVTGYGVTRTMDATSSISLSEISTFSSYQFAALQGKTAGVKVRGDSSDSAGYYIDGIRVSGTTPPVQDADEFAGVQVRSAFRDHAYWQPVLTTDAQGEAAFQVTFPDDLTTWDAYAVAADARGRAGLGTIRTRTFKTLTAQLAVPRFAVAGDQFDVSGRIVHRNPDSVSVSTRFLLNNRTLHENKLRILQGAAEYARLEIPTNADTALVNYELSSGAMNDGEQRSIPVLPVGTLETSGLFFVLETDTSFTLSFPAGPHPLTLYAEKSPVDLLFRDIEYLKKYPYGCNEQTSGRLLALLALKRINTYQQKPFLYEKDIRACLKKLNTAQLPDGSWGWWAAGTPNHWMTIYVAKALWAAKKAGYVAEAFDRAQIRIRSNLSAMNTWDQVEALSFLRESGVNIDCSAYLNRIDTGRQSSLTDRLNILKLKQLCGQEIVRDSLNKYLRRTTFGGTYLGMESTEWYDRRGIQTLQAYRIAQVAGWTDITRGIERYWIQNRSDRLNTIETAQVLEALLPVLLGRGDTLRPVRLGINGSEIKHFPVARQYDPAQGSTLEVTKTGSAPVYLTAYQQWHEPAPAARSDVFEVHTQLLLANGSAAQTLRYGEAATLEVQVEVKAAADYVMIEVPIPAGCGYGDKKRGGWPEVHREYFKDRTAIFCERLAVGKYVFSIPVEPRFTGSFTLNPARVEQMYFPVFFGRNEVKKVNVEK